MVSKEIQEAIDILRAEKTKSKGVVMTPERALEDRHHIDGILGSLPPGEYVVNTERVETDDLTGEFYTYDPIDPQKLQGKVLLFLHGGGFMNGSVLSRRRLCHDIMGQARIDALSVEYGQWPEAEHPQALNDCVAAYHWLLGKGYAPSDVYVFGESAGAMLTLTMILYLKDKGEPLPGKALVFSPVAGQELELPSHSERDERDPMISYEPVVPYYRNADFSSPFVSPGYGDFTGFPRLAIHVGSEEVLFDDARLIFEKCTNAGVDVSWRIWEGLFHVFPLFHSPETTQAIEEIGFFFTDSVL